MNQAGMLPEMVTRLKRDQSATTSWGYEEGPSKGPRSHAMLVVADF